MNIDLSRQPYSCKGSYLVISRVGANWCGCKNVAGLYLRTVRGGAAMPLIARICLNKFGQTAEYTSSVEQAALVLDCDCIKAEFCFSEDGCMLVRCGNGITLTLDFMSHMGAFDYIYSFSRNSRLYRMANCYKNSCRYLFCPEKGESTVDQVWAESSCSYSRLTFSGTDGFEFSMREIMTEWDAAENSLNFDECRTEAARSLAEFEKSLPSCPAAYSGTAGKASYLLWSSLVKKGGLFTRDAMLMSKNWMKNVWSWDHCFNAMALSYGAPEQAWDQFMIMFDRQDETGLLPDSVNDAREVWNFCKPPIHGWALRHMMNHMTLTRGQTEEAYIHLQKWTNWWTDYRDYDVDGLCEYNHGNDSGWDNSTVFSVLPPVATPELQAFLVIQMDVLSQLALKLGRTEEAAIWAERSNRLLKLTLDKLFSDNQPVAVKSGSHEIIPNDSLLPYICVILGEKLPASIRQRITETLKGDRFLTEHGLATESPASPEYRSDGYWRGPIWAPSTMLAADGLARCGETALAREIAKRFTDMVTASGFAENFDALTGDGLRDKAYTWTASVFMILAHEYL